MARPVTIFVWQFMMAMVMVAQITPSAWAQPRAQRLEGHACAPMRWESERDKPRVALSTPVRVNGRRYWFQFDTAAWPNMLYGDESDRRGWSSSSAREFSPRSFQAGGATFDNKLLALRRGMESDGLAGTLGFNSLMGKLTVIDYRTMRLCILPRTADVTFMHQASWMPMRLGPGSLRVAMRIGDQTYSNMIFDTGSSMFPLVADLPLWTRLTGYNTPSEAPLVVQASAWGHPKTWRGAPTREPITIGNVISRDVNVFIDEAEPTTTMARLRADGIFGNALLWDHVVLLDLRDLIPDEQWAVVGAGAPRRQPRFGVVE